MIDLAAARSRFNLEKSSILLMDSTVLGMDILIQILTGFGAKAIHRCTSMSEGVEVCQKNDLDLIITDTVLQEGDGYEFVSWLRRSGPQNNRFVPVLMTASHTPRSQVMRARDCGAHFILAKPLTPTIMLERLLWVGREDRQFLACDSYAGPERRFKNQGPPGGGVGRRKDDLSPEVGEATQPNLDQDKIDAMFQSRKISI